MRHYVLLLLVFCGGAHCVKHHSAGDAARQAEQQMEQEIELLSQAVNNTPDDVITRPGEGLGVPSPGFKHLAQMELLVRGVAVVK